MEGKSAKSEEQGWNDTGGYYTEKKDKALKKAIWTSQTLVKYEKYFHAGQETGVAARGQGEVERGAPDKAQTPRHA